MQFLSQVVAGKNFLFGNLFPRMDWFGLEFILAYFAAVEMISLPGFLMRQQLPWGFFYFSDIADDWISSFKCRVNYFSNPWLSCSVLFRSIIWFLTLFCLLVERFACIFLFMTIFFNNNNGLFMISQTAMTTLQNLRRSKYKLPRANCMEILFFGRMIESGLINNNNGNYFS